MEKEYLEILRTKLNNYIIEYGIDDTETILISQQLDKYIVKEQMDIMSIDKDEK